jgi:hypothetical protein
MSSQIAALEVASEDVSALRTKKVIDPPAASDAGENQRPSHAENAEARRKEFAPTFLCELC